MQFILILDMPTYQSLWIKKYGTITPEFNYILQSFSEFQAGIYEQALLSYYKPGLNKNVITYFNFINWISGFYIKKILKVIYLYLKHNLLWIIKIYIDLILIYILIFVILEISFPWPKND
jgi:hypothetical protein